MRYFKILIILTGLWGINLSTSAQNFREESNISKTFKIAPSGTLELSNKYGSVYVDTWDKDSVKINIEFIIAEKNENRFKKIKNSVNFDFAGNSLYRTVKTQYGNSYSSLFKDLKEATNLFSSNADQTHVDYYITIPNYINLNIDNKYGNIILPSLLGDTDIKLSNGDFQARELKGNNQLELSFGSARLNAIERGNLKLNFLEASITKANNLTIESKSSNLNIEEANLLKLTSKRGDIEITNTNYLFSETEFCQLFINNISSEANIRLKYGILKKLNCQSGFESITIYSTHADVWLKLPKEDAYNIKTSYLKANCSSDKSIIWQPAEVADEEGTLTKSGYHLNKNSSSNVKIDITEANLNIY
ncbi:hypothetical protein [Labilibacter marinus]|uniref:hypothetical protein n=1 Tax=Labilibacter marinus TaxID=1477105 RepID=UPI000834FCC9|nr:hypothetical protein [Labilibacter marinus]